MKKYILVLVVLVSLFSCSSVTWEVSFDTKGGEALENVYVADGDFLSAKTVATKEGYNFLGWYLDEELTNRFDIVGTKVVANIKLFAKWEEIANAPEEKSEFTVNYNYNLYTGEITGDDKFVIKIGDTKDLTILGAKDTKQFKGWTTVINDEATLIAQVVDGKCSLIKPWDIKQDISIYAFWK